MMLANYINDLLYRYDCVIVPNFGGFVTNRIGARVNNYTHTFYPPTKQISFNNHLKHNDGLLVNYIAKAEQISFDKALENVTATLQKWQAQIQTDKITIASLGSLSLNKEKQIVFEPNTSVNFLTESFGLASFETSAISRLKDEAKPVATLLTQRDKKKGKIVPLIAKYAATAAILLTLGVLGWNGHLQNQQQQILANQQQELEQKIQTATFIIDTPLPTINLKVTKEDPKNYHIIAGAFQFVENAEKKVNQLKDKGFKPQIIGKNKWGLTQVTYSSYKTRNQALQALYNIRKAESQDAWLLIKKID